MNNFGLLSRAVNADKADTIGEKKIHNFPSKQKSRTWFWWLTQKAKIKLLLTMHLFLPLFHSTRVLRSWTSTVTAVLLLHVTDFSWAKNLLSLVSVPQILNDNLGSQEFPQSGLNLLFLTYFPLFWFTGNLPLYLYWRTFSNLNISFPQCLDPFTLTF